MRAHTGALAHTHTRANPRSYPAAEADAEAARASMADDEDGNAGEGFREPTVPTSLPSVVETQVRGHRAMCPVLALLLQACACRLRCMHVCTLSTCTHAQARTYTHAHARAWACTHTRAHNPCTGCGWQHTVARRCAHACAGRVCCCGRKGCNCGGPADAWEGVGRAHACQGAQATLCAAARRQWKGEALVTCHLLLID